MYMSFWANMCMRKCVYGFAGYRQKVNFQAEAMAGILVFSALIYQPTEQIQYFWLLTKYSGHYVAG
jgi:hypothetical protein